MKKAGGGHRGAGDERDFLPPPIPAVSSTRATSIPAASSSAKILEERGVGVGEEAAASSASSSLLSSSASSDLKVETSDEKEKKYSYWCHYIHMAS